MIYILHIAYITIVIELFMIVMMQNYNHDNPESNHNIVIVMNHELSYDVI
jgi:hypothetical protein